MKIVKYKVVGVLEDNYVENDYWNEYSYYSFEFDNGNVLVLTIKTNNFGDDSHGSEWSYRYMKDEYFIDSEFYKSSLWTENEVSKEEIKLIEECFELFELDWLSETDVIEV